MAELNFNTGLVSFSLNGAAEISFNPTDPSFVEGIYTTFEALDKKQDEYKAEAEKAQGKKEIFDVAKKWDTEMREMIDTALGAPVCDAVFGSMNVYAMADGFPVWANLMLAVLDQVDDSFAKEHEKTDSRIKRYTDRYRKKYHN